jgi:hypothetical protein
MLTSPRERERETMKVISLSPGRKNVANEIIQKSGGVDAR